MSSVEKLIDSNGSLVLVIRNFIDQQDAKYLCNYLTQTIKWRKEEVVMYGKRIMQPREIYACGDLGLKYRYSGLELEVEPWIPDVKAIIDQISDNIEAFNRNLALPEDLKFPTQIKLFDSCLLNLYRTGADYISYHRDKEALGPNNAVLTISLGGTRNFYFKGKGETIKTKLENGDCVIMCGNTQRDYTHSIPKRAVADLRISLTYRLIGTDR